ncbi:hypothetical protein GCM10008018_12990 [Paenibacillus marchantiophytorum]|uniref:SLH domain-containing protein n=2 Tax=Paenibacillus marchantiophytorum TaxID=1619310 RepID=A0ABQ2BR58_9BACL|nr:hypothetical protein GCM10008018_12990 [Paenibacillus marchantiophytorum]
MRQAVKYLDAPTNVTVTPGVNSLTVNADVSNQAVNQAVKNSIINGYEDGTFRPEQPVTRVEMAVMIVRALGLKLVSDEGLLFSDSEQVPQWARPYVATAYAAGLIHGRDNNEFAPNDEATRAEATILILGMLKIK